MIPLPEIIPVPDESGYVLWDMVTDTYLCTDTHSSRVGWQLGGEFSLINEEDIEGIQQLLLSKGKATVTSRQWALYSVLESIKSHVRVVPCVVSHGERPKFDFVNGYRFAWD